MSKAIQATLNRAEAETLRSTASGIDVAFPPDPLAARFMRDDAAELEARAADTLALDTPPPVGTGGELIPAGDQIKHGGGNFIDTVERPDYVTAAASMDRLKLADEVQCVSLAVDTAETIQAKNSIEKMIAHQLAAAHKLAMTLAGKAQNLIEEDGSGWHRPPTVYATEASRVAKCLSEDDGRLPEGHPRPPQAQDRRHPDCHCPARQRQRWWSGGRHRGHQRWG